MRKLLLIPLVLVLNACATATIHEVCSEPQVAARYKDYDQCYAAVSYTHLYPPSSLAISMARSMT